MLCGKVALLKHAYHSHSVIYGTQACSAQTLFNSLKCFLRSPLDPSWNEFDNVMVQGHRRVRFGSFSFSARARQLTVVHRMALC